MAHLVHVAVTNDQQVFKTSRYPTLNWYKISINVLIPRHKIDNVDLNVHMGLERNVNGLQGSFHGCFLMIHHTSTLCPCNSFVDFSLVEQTVDLSLLSNTYYLACKMQLRGRRPGQNPPSETEHVHIECLTLL